MHHAGSWSKMRPTFSPIAVLAILLLPFPPGADAEPLPTCRPFLLLCNPPLDGPTNYIEGMPDQADSFFNTQRHLQENATNFASSLSSNVKTDGCTSGEFPSISLGESNSGCGANVPYSNSTKLLRAAGGLTLGFLDEAAQQLSAALDADATLAWMQAESKDGFVAHIEPLNSLRTAGATVMIPDGLGAYAFRVSAQDSRGLPYNFTDWRAEVVGFPENPLDSEPSIRYSVGSYGEADIPAPSNNGDHVLLVRVSAAEIHLQGQVPANLLRFLFWVPDGKGGELATSYGEASNLLLSQGQPSLAERAERVPTPLLLVPRNVPLANIPFPQGDLSPQTQAAAALAALPREGRALFSAIGDIVRGPVGALP